MRTDFMLPKKDPTIESTSEDEKPPKDHPMLKYK